MHTSNTLNSAIAPIRKLFELIKDISPEAKKLLVEFVTGTAIGVVGGLLGRKHHPGWAAAEILLGKKIAEHTLNHVTDPDAKKQGSRAIRAGILLGLGTTELSNPAATTSEKVLGIVSELAGGFETFKTILNYRYAHAYQQVGLGT